MGRCPGAGFGVRRAIPRGLGVGGITDLSSAQLPGCVLIEPLSESNPVIISCSRSLSWQFSAFTFSNSALLATGTSISSSKSIKLDAIFPLDATPLLAPSRRVPSMLCVSVDALWCCYGANPTSDTIVAVSVSFKRLLPGRAGLRQRAVELQKAGDADPFWRQFTAWPAAHHSRNNHTSHQSELKCTKGKGRHRDNDWRV